MNNKPCADTYRTGNQKLVREINLSLILSQLRKHAPISRADLAKLTGLNKTTVSSLIQELLERSFVREVGVNTGNTGRPSINLQPNPQAGYIVSVVLGVGYIRAICTDFVSQVLWENRIEFHPGEPQELIIHQLLGIIEAALSAGQSLIPNLLGVVVGVPGLVDGSTGSLVLAPNLKWHNVPLRDIIQDKFRVPVFVYNENHLGALNEYFSGPGQEFGVVLYIAANIGLGGAIIYSGCSFGSTVVLPARFGHMTVDSAGELCSCGNRGCWETQVNYRKIYQYVNEAIHSGQSSILAGQLTQDSRESSLTLVIEAARAGDQAARFAFEQVGRKLGTGMATLVNALTPEAVILGDCLAEAGEFLLPAATEELRRHVLGWDEKHRPQFLVSQSGYNASLLGGVIAVYQTVLPQPDQVTL